MTRIWIGIAAALVVGIAGILVFEANQPYVMHGSVIEPAVAAPGLTLVSSEGGSFRLEEQRGKILLVFFGYTYCPDVCPGTLAQLRQVMTKLGSQASSVQVVLATVDPKRDSPEQLKRFLSVFGSNYLGVTGSEEQLEPVWKAYGVYHAIRPVGENPNTYTVDHSTRIYLIDAQGRLRLTYPDASDIDGITRDLQFLLKGG